MYTPHIIDEFSPLKLVVLGTAKSVGEPPLAKETYDPKSHEHVVNGTYPEEDDLIEELEGFASVLKRYGVEVLRPKVLEDYNQIFTRDIAFTLDNRIVITNMIKERSREIDAIQDVISKVEPENVMRMKRGCRLEGGDIIPVGDQVFIGYSESPDFDRYMVARTNLQGVHFVEEHFPHRKVRAFELRKSDTNARENALHLDCCFQPLGLGHCIIHREGFKKIADVEYIESVFGKENCIYIDQQEMYDMGANVFSIAPNVVVSERGFTRINQELRDRGYTVEEIKYSECAKMEGLLRCSTLPIIRA
jgi:N-dimethylarginine dimethylaminohydrolase